jgi:hypothetical protein
MPRNTPGTRRVPSHMANRQLCIARIPSQSWFTISKHVTVAPEGRAAVLFPDYAYGGTNPGG